MPKLLILAACAIAGAELSAHADVGDVVDVSKDDASQLARMGRGLYLDKLDDPSKGLLTADADDKKRVAGQAAAIAAERDARELVTKVQSPIGQAEMIASAVAAAVAAAMAPAVAAQAAASSKASA